MKSFFILLIFISTAFITKAQTSVSIDVEDLSKPRWKLNVDSYQTILEDLIREDNGLSRFPLYEKHKDPPFNIVAKSNISANLVGLGYHPFFQGLYEAYAEHRPFTLSPDMVWLLISQGFSQHVNNNSEDLRKLFVDFDGKTTLIVNSNQITLQSPDSLWRDIFPEFSKQISEHTGKELTDILTADFSTTTPITKMASQITLMDAMKSYFNFIVIYISCGIPKVTIEGTTQDWEKVLAKTEALRKYKLDWWVDEMEPLLRKITAASKGEVDKPFWQSMFKYHSKGKCGSPTIIDGWIVKFFPYDKAGKRNNLDSLYLHQNLPNEIVKVDLDYLEGDGTGNFNHTPLEVWAGFVGLKQNDDTYGLRPEIGWMIRKKDIGDNKILEEQLKKQSSSSWDNSISINVKAVPKELLKIGPIRLLKIYFTGDIDIPDEMSKIKIDRLDVHGTITEDGIKRICKLFPNSLLKINGKQYVDGKAIVGAIF